MDMNCIDNKPSLVVALLLIITVNCQKPLISVNSTIDGGLFSIFCDAEHVNIPDPNAKQIFALTIFKTETNEPAYYLAEYMATKLPNHNKTYTRIPQHRRWKITFTGDMNFATNINTMKLVMYVPDATCDDTGSYSCQFNYVTSQYVNPVYSYGNLTVTLGLYDFDFSANSRYLFYGHPYYFVGDNITLTCRVTGSPSLQFQWEKWITRGNDRHDYTQVSLPETMIKTKAPTSPRGTESCLRYDMESTLSFPAIASDDQMLYRCFAIYQQHVKFDSITLTIM